MMKIFSGYTTNTIEDEKLDIDLTEISILSGGEEQCWEECHKESFCAAAVWDKYSPKCTLKERVIFCSTYRNPNSKRTETLRSLHLIMIFREKSSASIQYCALTNHFFQKKNY